ncbi:hypothetical protein EYD00_13895 [Agrobacterium sp. 33MFTa1.1]|uniref:hypothetical protein n=1 Tax=Agrobacterium sp. 33MFTa1.1 TaxID=1279031 RepID=UPI00103DB1E0|nr:hypothetical protein [Agrobacterium sp. 33MFTa1.1]QBJ14611.1 hypothetical protein EYD00_13895 [Agrobacterium sp. 33MFTa1.1]
MKKSFSLGDFESYLDSLWTDPQQELRLPNALKADAVGGQASLMQLIITWARRAAGDTRLRIYADGTDEASIANFSSTAAGLVALNFARTIRGYGDMAIERSRAMETALPFVEAMHFGHLRDLRTFAKNTIPLICIDNAKRLARPNRLYSPNSDHVRSRRDFAYLLHAAGGAILPRSRPISDSRLINAAASLMYEAFLNTHEHAQTDAAGNVYRRSVRGVLIGSRYIKRDQLVPSASGHRPIEDYFQAWRPDHPNAQHAQFVEMSIFDSGDGLAQTWLQKKARVPSGILGSQISLGDEFEAVLACFRKGGTTKGGETSGNGLFRIMRVVSENGGFIRVRSGRLSLVHVAGVPGHQSDVDEGLEDSIEGGRPSQPRAWADGTLITVMLPLNRERD